MKLMKSQREASAISSLDTVWTVREGRRGGGEEEGRVGSGGVQHPQVSVSVDL